MSNTYKVIIAVIAIAVLGAASIFLVGQNRGGKSVTNQSSSAVSSVKSLVVSSSMQSQIASSVLSSSQVQISSSVKAESEVVVSSPKVEFLDSNNPPQYIKDYLACENKKINDIPVGVFLLEDTKIGIEYKCPQNKLAQTCNVNQVYAPMLDYGMAAQMKFFNNFKSGWNCAITYEGKFNYETNYGFEKNFCEIHNPNVEITFISVDYINQVNHSCIIITKSNTTQPQKAEISQTESDNIKKLQTKEIKSIIIY